MKYPRLIINLKKIRHNSNVIVEKCQKHGIDVIGVTKCCLGSPEVALAMIEGGVKGIGDSRVENLKRLRNSGIKVELTSLRIPMLSEVSDIVDYSDISLVSELEVIKGLNKAAAKKDKKHKVILMVETGDSREGVLPDKVVEVVREVLKLANIDFLGIGTNFACLGGGNLSPKNLSILVNLYYEIKDKLSLSINVISGGNSSIWKLLEENKVPKEINEVRIGEAILLGRETLYHEPIPETYQDAFFIEGEVVEVAEKNFKQAIIALGEQDILTDGLFSIDQRIKIVRASSDHLIVDLNAEDRRIEVGNVIKFIPDYKCLLKAMTSPFVEKILTK